MRREGRQVVLAIAVWACTVAVVSVAVISQESSGVPVALSAFLPGDAYTSDLQDDQQVAPLEDPSMPSEEGEYSAMGPGDDDNAIQGLSDNPAMGHVATGRVLDVQRQVTCFSHRCMRKVLLHLS